LANGLSGTGQRPGHLGIATLEIGKLAMHALGNIGQHQAAHALVMDLGIPEDLAVLVLEADQPAFAQGIDTNALDPGRIPAIAPVCIAAGKQSGQGFDFLVLLIDRIMLELVGQQPVRSKADRGEHDGDNQEESQ